MDLETLSSLDLPGWIIIIAALTFIAKQVGFLDYLYGRFSDIQEHRQQSENIAVEALREIIRESITEYSKEMREFERMIYKLGRQIENNTATIRALTGIVSEKD